MNCFVRALLLGALGGSIVLTVTLGIAQEEKARKTRQETITTHFYLGQCPDDVVGASPANRWVVYYDNEKDEGTATCRFLVYDDSEEK